MVILFNKPFGVLSQFTPEGGHRALDEFGDQRVSHTALQGGTGDVTGEPLGARAAHPLSCQHPHQLGPPYPHRRKEQAGAAHDRSRWLPHPSAHPRSNRRPQSGHAPARRMEGGQIVYTASGHAKWHARYCLITQRKCEYYSSFEELGDSLVMVMSCGWFSTTPAALMRQKRASCSFSMVEAPQ